MAWTLSMSSLNVHCTDNTVTMSGSIYHNVGTSTQYGFEINGVKVQKGTSLPLGTTNISHSTTSTPNTVLTVRVYVYITGVGYNYSGSITRTMYSGMATAVTTSITDILGLTATGGGTLTCGWTAVSARGVCWNTSTNPTIANSKTIDGSGLGTYTSYLTGLSGNTHYYVRAYATNSYGTAYGAVVE
jgi:hypothetical protein